MIIRINPASKIIKYRVIDIGSFSWSVSGRKNAAEAPKIIPSEIVLTVEAKNLYWPFDKLSTGNIFSNDITNVSLPLYLTIPLNSSLK